MVFTLVWMANHWQGSPRGCQQPVGLPFYYQLSHRLLSEESSHTLLSPSIVHPDPDVSVWFFLTLRMSAFPFLGKTSFPPDKVCSPPNQGGRQKQQAAKTWGEWWPGVTSMMMMLDKIMITYKPWPVITLLTSKCWAQHWRQSGHTGIAQDNRTFGKTWHNYRQRYN